MSFMEVEITEKQNWYEVDGPAGTEYIPFDLARVCNLKAWNKSGNPEVPNELHAYCENTRAWEIKVISGYGVRLSAPGYMDCTEWAVFETLEEAEEHASELDEENGELSSCDEDEEECD